MFILFLILLQIKQVTIKLLLAGSLFYSSSGAVHILHQQKLCPLLKLTLLCPGQPSAELSAVRDNPQQNSALTGTALSRTQRCPGQHSAKLSANQDSAQSDLFILSLISYST